MVTDRAMISEARQVISYAARNLTERERTAVAGWLRDQTEAETARQLGISDSSVNAAKFSGLDKLRHSLRMMGIESSADLLGRCS